MCILLVHIHTVIHKINNTPVTPTPCKIGPLLKNSNILTQQCARNPSISQKYNRHPTSNISEHHISYIKTAYNKEFWSKIHLKTNTSLHPDTLNLPTVTPITTVEMNRLLRQKIFSRLFSTKYTMRNISIYKPIALQYKSINCKNVKNHS